LGDLSAVRSVFVDADGTDRAEGGNVTSSVASELLGLVLEGRYRVDRLLARGGMSSVYQGVDLRLDRPVAIKVMESRFAGDRSFIDRFVLEARAAAKLHHPNVVAVHDQGVDGDHVFLVMELVSGGTLRDLLREHRVLPPEVALAVLEPVLSALAAAHQAGLVHRDVKPENVLIGPSGAIKVADFGLVRAMATASTTSAKLILGTVAYLSPEQVATGSSDARSDVYSAGVMLYEMLTGVPPYQADTPLSVAYRHVNDDVPPPSDLQPELPPALDDLVLRATRRDPEQRPVDAMAFLTEVGRIRAGLGLPRVRVPEVSRPAGQDGDELGQTEAMTAPSRNDPDRTVRTRPVGPGPIGPQGTRAWNRDELGMPAPLPAGAQPGRPARPSYADQRRRNRRLFLIWIAVVLALAVVIGGAAWWLGSGRWTAVPSVTGLDTTSAEHVLQGADLAVSVKQTHDNTVPAGRAIGTDPGSGKRALRGSTVTLLMSEGKPVVPDVSSGVPLAAAQQALTQEQLQPRTDPNANVYDDTAPAGTVVRLVPGPGTPADIGAVVTIVLSKGPAPKPVPDVAGQTKDQATATLAAQGFQAVVAGTTFSDQVPGGSVISTNPAAGTVLDPNASHQVGLVLSNAVTVPDVTGQTVADAQNALTALGLQVQVQQLMNFGGGRVFQQSVAPQSLVPPGTAITIVAFP
jgi:beta-lactam-binding protein with PASTA domain